MKKLFILILLMTSMFFCACNGNKTENGEAKDSLILSDTIFVDSTLAEHVEFEAQMCVDTTENTVVLKNPVVSTKTIN